MRRLLILSVGLAPSLNANTPSDPCKYKHRRSQNGQSDVRLRRMSDEKRYLVSAPSLTLVILCRDVHDYDESSSLRSEVVRRCGRDLCTGTALAARHRKSGRISWPSGDPGRTEPGSRNCCSVNVLAYLLSLLINNLPPCSVLVVTPSLDKHKTGVCEYFPSQTGVHFAKSFPNYMHQRPSC